MANKSPTPSCSQCGSKLILISRTTQQAEGSMFPQTISEYRCSNKDCQDERDKQTAKRIKAQKDRDKTNKEREKLKVKQRKDAVKLKLKK